MRQETALKVLQTGANVFLTGEPGSGKTHTVNAYVTWLRQHAIEPSITASTGIAATHIGGMTIHAWSGIGIRRDLDAYELDRISQGKGVASRIGSARVLIIDEVSMLSATLLSMVDAVCREVRRDQSPFGGLQVILVGDFFQLPPVVAREGSSIKNGMFTQDDGGRSEFAFDSPAWNNLDPIVCYLSEQHRQEDATFLEFLSALRGGNIVESHKVLLRKRYSPTPKAGITQLYAHNVDVNAINDAELVKIDAEARAFLMTTQGPAKLVERLKQGCLSPENLSLKLAARVMFTKNDVPMQRYANGTLGIVVGFEEESGYPVVKINSGRIITALPDEWRTEDGGRVLAKIEQIPLRLAWAMTVHKSQGMSLDAAHMDLSQVFEYGQGYVALSRLRSLTGLSLAGLNARALEVHPQIRAKDAEFRNVSAQARDTFGNISDEEFQTMQRNFIRAMGGREHVNVQKSNSARSTNVSRLAKLREKFPNAGRSWSAADDELLKKMFAEDKPQKEMATHFGRKGSAIHARLGHLGLVEDYWAKRRKQESKKM